ncbi:MAG TPA: hypothetical protein VE954_04795 [Oligoflexus sp.]|uniref:hypothetical protein n=1 Tax=Oligoflexus sp. TaxID=1971216 RepID=UPI002D4DFAA3|nr:hypothetical protein [Oligoflexus sp.]HYX32409.1 hypothetical protein [Oligoflexus sp.]
MQEAQAHPSLIYHGHPHVERFAWQDGLFLTAVMTFAWVLKTVFFKDTRNRRLEHNSRRENGKAERDSM